MYTLSKVMILEIWILNFLSLSLNRLSKLFISSDIPFYILRQKRLWYSLFPKLKKNENRRCVSITQDKVISIFFLSFCLCSFFFFFFFFFFSIYLLFCFNVVILSEKLDIFNKFHLTLQNSKFKNIHIKNSKICGIFIITKDSVKVSARCTSSSWQYQI